MLMKRQQRSSGPGMSSKVKPSSQSEYIEGNLHVWKNVMEY